MRGHRTVPSEHYAERDHVSWLRRTIATVSTWFALAGYTLFALVFTSAEDNLKTPRRVLTAVAGIFLILGYIGGIGAYFLSSSPAYRHDSVVYPFMLASFGGLMEVVLNHSLHQRFPVGDIYIYLPLFAAIISTLFCLFLSFTTIKKLDQLKRTELRARQEVPMWETHSFAGNRDQDPGQVAGLLGMNVPEDEAQRQQLQRLLIAKQQENRGPSPDASSTYRIEWQADEDPTRLAVPQHSRPRSGSAPSITNRWHISNLLGGGGKKQPARPPSTETLVTQREERRREIERSSLSSPPTGWVVPKESQAWGGQTIRYR